MNRYLLTNFLYPLENPIYLSNKLDLSLDNLRDKKEIEALKKLIKTSTRDDETVNRTIHHRWLPKTAEEGEVSVENGVKKFFKRKKSIGYISKFYNKYQSNDCWDIISGMCIVLRVGDSSEIYRSLDEKEASKLFYPEDEDPIYENAVNYSYLLSLLISNGNDDYFGETFVIPQLNYLIEDPEPNVYINKVIALFFITNFMDYAPKKSDKFHDFDSAIELLQAKSNQIEQILNKETVKNYSISAIF